MKPKRIETVLDVTPATAVDELTHLLDEFQRWLDAGYTNYSIVIEEKENEKLAVTLMTKPN